jgi:hypothetical protein
MAASFRLDPVSGQDRHAALDCMIRTGADHATYADRQRNLADRNSFSRSRSAREEHGK